MRLQSGRRVSIAVLAAAIGFVLAIAPGAPTHTSIAATAQVEATNVGTTSFFDPDEITIAVGDTVQWSFSGEEVHDAVGTGVEVFDSGLKFPGQTFSHTFNIAGSFSYICTLHQNMAGIVKVVAAPESPGDWSLTGQMAVPSNYGAIALLNDGSVLAIGGNDSNDILRRSERYLPASNTWISEMEMDTPRQGHTATTLETGEVLVTGGETSPGVYLNSAQRFDPALHNWSSTGGMGASRTQQTATLLLDGRVLITGGITKSGPIFSTAATAEVYERDGDTWSSAGAMSDARAGHTATRLLDGRVLVAGGDDEGGPLDSVDIYAPLMNDWIAAAPMIEARTHAAASLLPDGRVLMAGGGGFGFSDTVEIYDPQTNTWTSAPDMHHVRRGLSATTLADGRVLVAAGDDATPATSEIYDPVLNNWLTTGLMHPQRGLHAAALLGDSGVLVVGGSDVADAPSEAAEVYAAALPDDNDGVLAGIDNCPFVANPSQANADAAPVVTAGAPADASRPRSDGFGDACDSDDDGDGLSDLAESLLDLAPYAAGCAGATSASVPFLVDSDSDLTVDGAECVLGTDPTDTNSKPSPVQPGDPDLDGLPTSLEQLIGSNPNNADTDGDGITDGIEYRGYATFPTLADSDGDGCTDGAEIASVDGSSAVNSLDLVLVAQRFLRTDQPVHDVNKDGTVNSLDLQLVARNFDPGGCP